jgi:HD domain
MRLADIPVPSTAAAKAAVEVLTQFSPPALVHHCHRSYLLAAALATQEGVEIEAELLYVAALLHDLALEPAFDNHTLPFEEAGGHVAWVLAAGAGWPAERRDRAAGIIVAHMRGADPETDPEGDLLDVATGLDIGGRDVERWPEPLLAEIVAAYPRLDLAERFTACFRDQANRKPASAAAAAIRAGLGERLAANPLDHLA